MHVTTVLPPDDAPQMPVLRELPQLAMHANSVNAVLYPRAQSWRRKKSVSSKFSGFIRVCTDW